MDLNKLRTEVFEKTGIKVDTTDPIFALVALNEAVLADYAQQNLAGLHEATEKLKEQTKQLHDAGERAKALLLQMGHKVDDPAPPAAAPHKPLPWPLFASAGITALLTAALVLALQSLFAAPHQPLPAPPVVQASAPAPALTPEQQQLIQSGEKFAKAWPKLDAKTQARIQALMQ
ncbi:MAG: hypothetical protein JO002_08160 [Burkholderiaceae bacterium]|nr:hypothetical protein [Burkholderiaceae bacterium]